MKHKKGVIALYIVFIMSAIMILLIAAVFAPMGVLFNTKMYEMGEEIMLMANESVSEIENATVRDRISGVITTGLEDAEFNIEVNSDIFQYSWVFIIALTAVIFFLLTRRIVEYGGGGAV